MRLQSVRLSGSISSMSVRAGSARNQTGAVLPVTPVRGQLEPLAHRRRLQDPRRSEILRLHRAQQSPDASRSRHRARPEDAVQLARSPQMRDCLSRIHARRRQRQRRATRRPATATSRHSSTAPGRLSRPSVSMPCTARNAITGISGKRIARRHGFLEQQMKRRGTAPTSTPRSSATRGARRNSATFPPRQARRSSSRARVMPTDR